MQFSIDMMMKIRVVLKILEKDNFQCKKRQKISDIFHLHKLFGNLFD